MHKDGPITICHFQYFLRTLLQQFELCRRPFKLGEVSIEFNFFSWRVSSVSRIVRCIGDLAAYSSAMDSCCLATVSDSQNAVRFFLKEPEIYAVLERVWETIRNATSTKSLGMTWHLCLFFIYKSIWWVCSAVHSPSFKTLFHLIHNPCSKDGVLQIEKAMAFCDPIFNWGSEIGDERSWGLACLCTCHQSIIL